VLVYASRLLASCDQGQVGLAAGCQSVPGLLLSPLWLRERLSFSA
jgi:hypothetical protein